MSETRHLSMSTLEEAIAFAEQTKKVYKKALLQKGKDGGKPHHATLPQYRRSFIESYLTFKRFLNFYKKGNHEGSGK